MQRLHDICEHSNVFLRVWTFPNRRGVPTKSCLSGFSCHVNVTNRKSEMQLPPHKSVRTPTPIRWELLNLAIMVQDMNQEHWESLLISPVTLLGIVISTKSKRITFFWQLFLHWPQMTLMLSREVLQILWTVPVKMCLMQLQQKNSHAFYYSEPIPYKSDGSLSFDFELRGSRCSNISWRFILMPTKTPGRDNE